MDSALLTVLIVLGLIAALYAWAQTSPSKATALLMGMLRRLVRLKSKELAADDLTWRYLEKGESNLDVVLLVHGFGADKDTWLGYVPHLGSHYRVICPDLPGFGDATDEMLSDFTPKQQAERLLAFMSALRVESAHVVGSSMGGFIAAWMAILAPRRIASLTLMNAAGVSGATPSFMEPKVIAGESPLVPTNPGELDEVLSMLSVKPLFIPSFVKRNLLNRYLKYGELWRKIFDDLVQAQQDDRIADLIAEIQAPTLVVWGDSDQVLHVSCADVFVEQISHSRLLVLPRVGHIPMYEAPLAAARAQLALMDSAAASS
ncbi:MAG: alpha/beta fold hydrolase [Pseudomonadota bacterium]